MSTLLIRELASEKVASHTFRHKQYAAVSIASCRHLLGNRTDLLLDDPIRNVGPTIDTIYPWNVIDYLVNENPRARRGRQ